MTYPTHTIAPSIYTDFIDGFKFDICELDKSCYNMIINPRYRFFLCVEDNFICGFDFANEYFNKTKEERYDLFCGTRQEMIEKIERFKSLYNSLNSHLKLVSEKPNFAKSRENIINNIKQKIFISYGVQL